MTTACEVRDRFACFGATCGIAVLGDGDAETATSAAARARRQLLDWHDRFSRFIPSSELSRLNGDDRETLPISDVMSLLVAAVVDAGERSDGLVDATLLPELEAAGYLYDLGESLPLATALALAPPRRPARPRGDRRWRALRIDRDHGTLTRPPGLTIDAGGIAKGLFADLIVAELATHSSVAIDCAGDLRLGGSAGIARAVNVESPFDARVLHSFELSDAGIATSGIGRRSWRDATGAPAHHLLDPATGRPAFTGVVQATALAPTAVEAELRAKAALLSGPEPAREWLVDGGVLVFDDGSWTLCD